MADHGGILVQRAWECIYHFRKREKRKNDTSISESQPTILQNIQQSSSEYAVQSNSAQHRSSSEQIANSRSNNSQEIIKSKMKNSKKSTLKFRTWYENGEVLLYLLIFLVNKIPRQIASLM